MQLPEANVLEADDMIYALKESTSSEYLYDMMMIDDDMMMMIIMIGFDKDKDVSYLLSASLIYIYISYQVLFIITYHSNSFVSKRNGKAFITTSE